MLLDRYLGIQSHLYLGQALKASNYDDYTAKGLELVRLYFPELYILALLKCKSRHWKSTYSNIDDLYNNLCHKIGFNRFKANTCGDRLNRYFCLKEPFIDNEVFQQTIENFKNDPYSFNIHNRQIFEIDISEYISLRNQEISLLNSHNITSDNLAFGSFTDMTKDVFNSIFKNEI